MGKTILSKITSFALVCLILVIFISSPFSKTNITSGYDYNKSGYWDGSDLSISPITGIEYTSEYVPFSNISSNSSNIDISKIYVIENAIDLYQMSVACMGVDSTLYLSLHYVLGNDINYDEASEHGYLFHPIGFETNKPFTGTFDGQGFEISQLYFEPISSYEEYSTIYKDDLRYYSFFSRVALGATVKNLGLINPIMIQPIDWGAMKYAAPLVGLNRGMVDHVYVIDNRVDSGISVDGDFYLSGLMSINEGTLSNAYVSAKTIKSFAVTTNLDSRIVVYNNTGTINKVYYDRDVFKDVVNPFEISQGINTSDFQNPSYFSNQWFFNNAYTNNTQGKLNNTYPILKGIKLDGQGNFKISNAIELMYISTLLESSLYFRNKTYILTKDIDMNAIASNAYKASSAVFSGIFESELILNNDNTLYDRIISEDNPEYYSIVGLSILSGTVIGTSSSGTYVSYGLFGILNGSVKNINIIDALISPNDLSEHINKTRNLFGIVAGNFNDGTLNNVHVFGDINLSNDEMGKVYIGGLVGYGKGMILSSTANGEINTGIHSYNINSNLSAVGGIIGNSLGVMFSKVINQMKITGIGFSASNDSTLYLGGIMGYGITNGMSEVINLGTIKSHHDDGFIYKIHLGGIVGLHIQDNFTIYRIFNNGIVNLLIKGPIIAKVAGYGNIKSNNNLNLYSIANQGHIFTSHINDDNNLSINDLENVKIEIAGVAITDGTNAYFQGVYNKANLSVDLSVVNYIAANIIANNNYSIIQGVPVYDNVSNDYGTSTKIVQSYNYGNINAITKNSVTSYQIKISGNTLGKNIDYDQLRNNGNIIVHFSHPTTKLLSSAPDADGVIMPYKNLKVMGVLEEVSQNKYATNCYNGGKISTSMDSGLLVKFNLYISGIAYKNANTQLFADNNIDYKSAVIKPNVNGSLHNCINDGEIYSNGEFYGQSRISGIVSVNASMVTSAFNTGNIYNQNTIKVVDSFDSYSSNEFEVETAGITFLMSGQYAQILNSANYGTITSYASSQFGWVNASGIAVRNEKTENGTDYGRSSTSGSHFGKIQFSINYGTIYAWNQVDESSFTVSRESQCKASGILTLGVLSTINIINYGNVYSRYVASGIFGFVFFQKFTIGLNEVYVANSINYGKVRRLLPIGSGINVSPFTYDSETQNTIINPIYIDQNYVSKNESYSAFGAVIGKIHTNSETWIFISGDFSIRYVIFSYLINFDELIDLVGKSPNANISQNNTTSLSTNSIVNNLNRFLATVKLGDQSSYPFNQIKSYSLDMAPITGNSGLPGTNTTYSGIFNESFTLRTPPANGNGRITDQYIRDYIQFIPYSKVNTALASVIGLDSVGQLYGDETGIYALSSATGITNGEFIPDNVNFQALSPVLIENDEVIVDESWLDNINSGGISVRYKFLTGMKQLTKEIASVVFDMELVCVQNPAIVLRDPEINLEEKIITYYVASNSDASIEKYAIRPIYKYSEAGPDVEGSLFVPYEYNSVDGKWVGQFKKVNDQYVATGPYNSNGRYNVNFLPDGNDNKIRAWYYSDGVLGPRYIPATQSYIFEKLYYFDQTNGSGYNTIHFYAHGSLTTAGYGPYIRIDVSGNRVGYIYSGPNPEPVTYVRYSDSTEVYEDSYTFQVNMNSNYLLSKNASFKYTYNGSQFSYEGNKTASVPPISGVYGEVYSGSTLISRMTDHFGLVRVYAEAYDHENSTDPYTYTDYTIRIIRTPDESFTNVNALTVDGFNAKPTTIPNIKNVNVTSREVYYKQSGNLGILSVTYDTLNIPNNANLLDQTVFKYTTTNANVDPNHYQINGGRVQTSGAFNHITGEWGEGTVTFEIIVSEFMPSGTYTLEVALAIASNNIYKLNFNKIKSADANIILIDFDEVETTFESPPSTLISEVPYGINYHVDDYKSRIVNFSNLSQIINVSESNLHNNIPSYLDNIKISQYARLNSVVMTVALNNNDAIPYRYIYSILYTIQAENGAISTFTHKLYECEVNKTISKTYRDGNVLNTTPIDQIQFERESFPTYRIDYYLENTYFYNNEELEIQLLYSGDDITPVNGQHYFTFINPNAGFIVEFAENAPVGTYQFLVSYVNSNPALSLSWDIDFQSVTIIKNKNNNSHLKYITFVTDTVYSGLDTIIDISVMDAPTYEGYLLDRSTREIITLPNSGICYNDYYNYNAYWIVGQVQRTNLGNYSPSFYLPYGSQIYRITNEEMALYPEYQSTDYYYDFNPSNDENAFNYVHYRVYAEDYIPNDPVYGSNFTDYYIAVQDITNNVRFSLQVIIDSSINDVVFDKLYVTFNAYTDNEISLSMSVFSYFYQTNHIGTHTQLTSSYSGLYKINVDLPLEYTYVITFKNQIIDAHEFVVEDSVIPRKYAVVITIIESNAVPPWGQNESGSFESHNG